MGVEILGETTCFTPGGNRNVTIKRGAKNYGGGLYYVCPSCGTNPCRGEEGQMVLKSAIEKPEDREDDFKAEIVEELAAATPEVEVEIEIDDPPPNMDPVEVIEKTEAPKKSGGWFEEI